MNQYLDTNAIVKLYHEEKGTAELTKYLSEISEEFFLDN